MKNKISVVVCTYNGEEYLSAQLQSIIDQTRPPDEIVISDDQSTDNTVKIIREFMNNKTDCIKFYQNQSRLGYIKNFESGIRLITGNIIFLSDQDDVWDKRKIEIFENVFEANNNAGLLFSNAEIVDDQLNRLSYNLWEHVGLYPEIFTKFNQTRLLQYLITKPRVTGATIAFRSEYISKILPFSNYIGHDEWLALCMTTFNAIVPIEQKLVKYRQHAFNQIGAKKKEKPPRPKGVQARNQRKENLLSSFSFHQNKLKGYIQFYNHVRRLGIELPRNILSCQHQKVVHHRNRLKAFQTGRKGYFLLLKEFLTLRYFKYSNGLKGFFSDLKYI